MALTGGIAMDDLMQRLEQHAAAYSLLGEKDLPALLREAAAALHAAPEVTPQMIAAAEEAYMPFGDMELALNCALAARPQGVNP